jgi:acetyltransferase-like isoleucine patch superfamily enzyme
LRGRLCFHLGPGASVDVGPGTWLRTDLAEVHVVAFAGARIEIGPEAFLNGCHLSAKLRVVLGRRAWIGPGTRIFDSDQHDLDAARPERSEPVQIGDHAWIAADVTVLRGVSIGAHAVVGTRSLVTGDVPAHALAFGAPARVRGVVGDRSKTR